MHKRWDFEQLLTDLIKRHHLVNNQLAQCPGGSLQHTQRNNKQVFFQATNHGGARKRVSISSRPDLSEVIISERLAFHGLPSRYAEMGIVPWKNLIVTYNTVEGGIDSRIIESEIINKLL